MILAIDIGNSSVYAGFFRGKKLLKDVETDTDKFTDFQKRILRYGLHKKDDVIICSVVPELTKKLSKFLRQKFKVRPMVLGKDVKTSMRSRYETPETLGQDRLATAYGAMKIYGAPCLVVDFGTAITFDYVSKRKLFEGGLIVPGINTSLKAMQETCRLIPKKMKIRHPKGFLGRSTKEAIFSGMTHGFGAMTQSLVGQFRKKYGSMKVIATGGMSDLITEYTDCFNYIDKQLVLKSLNMIAGEV